MKIKIYFTIFLVMFTGTIRAQYKDIDTKVIPENDVPEEIIKSQRKQFYDGFVTQWKLHTQNKANQNDTTYYMANFKNKGRRGNYAYYSTLGDLLASSIYMSPFDIPGNIKEYCINKYQETKIKSAELILIGSQNRQIYRVRLNKDGALTYLYFDTNGNPIDKRQVPPETFMFI
jgi:hypothetical protein